MKKSGWQYWVVLWQSSNADNPVALFQAASSNGAIAKARQQTEFGAFSCTSDNLSAVPAGADYQAASRLYRQLAAEAKAKQAAALALNVPLQLALFAQGT